MYIDTFINELRHLTTDNGPINENINTTLAKTTGEPSTTDSQELATSTNKELLVSTLAKITDEPLTSNYQEQHTSSDSALAAVAGGLGAIAFISCFMTSILLAVFVIKRQKRNNGKARIPVAVMLVCICYAASSTDSGLVACSKPKRSKRPNQPLFHAQWQATPSMKGRVHELGHSCMHACTIKRKGLL